MYKCIYIYIYIFTYMYIYLQIRIYIYIYLRIPVYKFVYTCHVVVYMKWLNTLWICRCCQVPHFVLYWSILTG